MKSIVNLANQLKIETVAEGVETEGQKALLKKLNCHFFQGFLVSEPLNIEAFNERFLNTKLAKRNKKKKPVIKHSPS